MTSVFVEGQGAPTRLPAGGCTNFRLRQLMRRLDQHYDAELAKAGLKTTQYSLLSHVLKLEPVSPGALAQAMKMQPSTLTRNLDALVRAGWVVLGAGRDARSRSASCTAAGRDKRAQAQRHWRVAQASLAAVVGLDHLAHLHQVMGHCLERLEQIGADTAGASGRD